MAYVRRSYEESMSVTAKKYKALSLLDLLQAPVWRWKLEGRCSLETSDSKQDALVFPAFYEEIPTDDLDMFIVAASIKLGNGHEFPGLAEVSVERQQLKIYPRRVFIGMEQHTIPSLATYELLCKETGSAKAYPVSCKLGVKVNGENLLRRVPVPGRSATLAAAEIVSWAKGLFAGSA